MPKRWCKWNKRDKIIKRAKIKRHLWRSDWSRCLWRHWWGLLSSLVQCRNLSTDAGLKVWLFSVLNYSTFRFVDLWKQTTNMSLSECRRNAIYTAITFHMSRRRCEMYCSHARMCVCLSAAACLHYCMDPDVTWGSGRSCPLVVHYWVDLQSVHGLHYYGNTRNAWQSPAVSARPTARRTHYACRRRLPSSAIKSTHLLRAWRYLQQGCSISSIDR